MDPLSVLRSFVMKNQLDQVVESESGSTIDFGGLHSFDKKALTAYKSEQGKGDFYDLQSLLFFIRDTDRSIFDAMKIAKEQGLMQVKLIDKMVRWHSII